MNDLTSYLSEQHRRALVNPHRPEARPHRPWRLFNFPLLALLRRAEAKGGA